MSRWKVDRRNLPYPKGAVLWAACCDGKKRLFPTWREAQDYADRMARTREVVLPRLRPQGEVTVSAIWDYDGPVVHYTDASGQIVQGTPADLARHAATLLALAEQEGTA